MAHGVYSCAKDDPDLQRHIDLLEWKSGFKVALSITFAKYQGGLRSHFVTTTSRSLAEVLQATPSTYEEIIESLSNLDLKSSKREPSSLAVEIDFEDRKEDLSCSPRTIRRGEDSPDGEDQLWIPDMSFYLRGIGDWATRDLESCASRHLDDSDLG